MGHQEDRQEASGVISSEEYRELKEREERDRKKLEALDAKKTPIGTIDCTPSWVSVVRIYLEVIQNSADPAKRADAKSEIMRCAALADLYVKEHKR